MKIDWKRINTTNATTLRKFTNYSSPSLSLWLTIVHQMRCQRNFICSDVALRSIVSFSIQNDGSSPRKRFNSNIAFSCFRTRLMIISVFCAIFIHLYPYSSFDLNTCAPSAKASHSESQKKWTCFYSIKFIWNGTYVVYEGSRISVWMHMEYKAEKNSRKKIKRKRNINQ